MTGEEILNRLSKCYRIYLDGDMKPVEGYDDTFYDGVLWAFARLTEIQPSDDEVDDMQNDEYIPLCPFGATDCVCDPAYIHYAHPEWYRSMHGDKTPEEVVNETCARGDRFPHCYDDEDK